MKTSEKGIALIKKHEGLRLSSYICPAGHYTIGYGHIRTASANQRISQSLAEELLLQDVHFAEIAVNSVLTNLNQNQFDALVSFTFNFGATALKNSTLLKKIKANAPEKEIRQQFVRWIYSNDKPLPGLIARRSDEANLFFSTKTT
jgi:lysozyme